MTCENLTTINKTPCDSYVSGGFCASPTMFRCPEYIKRYEPTLSFSAVNAFVKCPKMYYFSNILGVQVKRDFCSDAMKIGSMVDEWITGNDKDCEVETDSLWFVKSQAIFTAYLKLMTGVGIDNYAGQHEFHYKRDEYPQIHGFIDLHANDNTHFIELKVGKNPDFYLNPFWMRSQLGTYFLSNPNYKYGIVWAIRVPQLKSTGQFKDETLDDYKNRCVRDMLARPNHYFPGYDANDHTFGVKFYRTAFDINENENQYEMGLDGLMERYKMVAWQIRKCAKDGYWYSNGNACLHPFECNYKRICESGKISEDVYEYRKKK